MIIAGVNIPCVAGWGRQCVRRMSRRCVVIIIWSSSRCERHDRPPARLKVSPPSFPSSRPTDRRPLARQQVSAILARRPLAGRRACPPPGWPALKPLRGPTATPRRRRRLPAVASSAVFPPSWATLRRCPLEKQEAIEKCWAHSPLRAAVTLPFTRCRYCRTPAIAIAQAACNVHNDDDDDDDNDNA